MSENMTEHGASLRQSIRSTCSRIQSAYLAAGDTPAKHKARAALADLRRDASMDLEKDPLALEKTLFVLEPPIGEHLLGKGDVASPSEQAACSAMTLFAIHMQSATSPMHNPEQSFAYACGRLYALSTSDSIKPRIDAMLLANNEQSRLIHLRSLITLLRAKSLSFDYGRFADDLRALKNPKHRPGVQLRWGRDFAVGSFAGKSKN